MPKYSFTGPRAHKSSLCYECFYIMQKKGAVAAAAAESLYPIFTLFYTILHLFEF